jgi:hypothetical protein
MKCTKWYHKITHPTDIISASTPRKRGPHNEEATYTTNSRTADTYNQILRLANLEMHGKERIGEGLVYEKMSRTTNIKLKVVLPPPEALKLSRDGRTVCSSGAGGYVGGKVTHTRQVTAEEPDKVRLTSGV